jgi:prolyl-tRNA synthetase
MKVAGGRRPAPASLSPAPRRATPGVPNAMKLSQLFTQTRREAPADVLLPGQQALFRAGYVQTGAANAPILLPLGQRALGRLEARLCGGLEGLGGLELGGASGEAGASLWAELARSQLRSYRQLPALFYHFTWQVSPTTRRGGGLFGARAHRVLAIHLLAADEERLDGVAAEVDVLLSSLLRDLGLETQAGAFLPGAGIQDGQAWLYPHPLGEEGLLRCAACGYAADPTAARYRRPSPPPEAQGPLELVATPETKTIAALAALLGISEARTAKAVFLTAQEAQLVFAVVRGDREVNEAALRRWLGTERLRPATEEEIRAVGAVPGYASPVGLQGVRVVADVQIPESPNLVAGANREGFHLRNVNYGRDYSAGEVAEIALARAGDACPVCGAPLVEVPGVRLADAGRWSTDAVGGMGVSFVDEHGKSRSPLARTVHVELTRILACLAEAWHDAYGLQLPLAVAPYVVHLVTLAGKDATVAEAAQAAAARLAAAGLEPLVDDRPDSPGVKFNDADLIGLPVRLTVSARTLQQGGVELKRRAESTRSFVPLAELVESVRAVLKAS